MRAIIIAVAVLALSACSHTPSKATIFSISATELEQLKLAYYSDYFSFVGWDDNGSVAFAIDTNRGRDGDNWQAEHFVVLHDEQSGWRTLQGSGPYDNASRRLVRIPDSPDFSFNGMAGSGLTIASASNNLRLEIDPIKPVIDNARGLSRYQLGSAAATLHWNGRTLKGRVIHEYLFLPAFNRLTRTYTDVFDDFHGIYAVIDQRGDFYFHSQASDFLAELTGYKEGFVMLNGEARPLSELTVSVTKRTQALGLYRWPVEWSGGFSSPLHNGRFELRLERRHNIANWLIGGFAMGMVRGELHINGASFPLLGLGELII